MPPSASTSRTTIPFADPPMEGLQGMLDIILIFKDKRSVFAPMCALAIAASIPAWPPPTTITS